MKKFQFRGALIEKAHLSGTKANVNVKRLDIVADMTPELLEMLGIDKFDPGLDEMSSKKKLALSNVVFTPNIKAGGPLEFQFGADKLGPFKFVRLKKDDGTTTEARFSIDTSAVDALAKVENYRNSYAETNGVLTVKYNRIEDEESDEPSVDLDQMTIEDAVEGEEPAEPQVSEINAMAERAQARKDARRKGAGVQ